MRCLPTRFAFALLALACVPSISFAGDGEIVGNKVNLGVTFAYEETDPDSWRPLFDEASRLLYNATNGQLQLGTIKLWTCAYDKAGADIWILDDFGGAFANPLGLSGEGHIYLSQTHKSTTGGAIGQFGLVHELGHYVFGMYDEYKGLVAPGRNHVEATPAEQTESREPNQFCTTDLDPVACLMDGGTTVAPNNVRTEFCTPSAIEVLSTAHNAANSDGGVTFVNFQEALNGESCWETMARRLGLEPPSAVDTSDPPGLEPIVWERLDNVSRIVIAIDRSESMNLEIGLAREAALQLVDLLHARRTIAGGDGSETTLPGESVAIVSFANDVTVDFPMQEIVDESVRDQARQAIQAIEVDGGTDLSGPLFAALDELTETSATPSCREAVVLLTDGRHTSGVDPSEALPAYLERGIAIYSVALGTVVDVEFLRNASTATGGLFFYAIGADELPAIYTQISAAVRSGGAIVTVADNVSNEGRDIAVLVDRFSEEVTAALTWDGPALELTLTSPTGEVIDVASASTRPDVDAIVREGFLYLRVRDPEAGDWMARVVPTEPVTAPVPFDVAVLSESRRVEVSASVEPQVVEAYEPMRVRVDAIAGIPIAGAEVHAVVSRPLVKDVVIDLFDDGDPAHGDDFAGDGVYQALFDRYTINGVYTFDVYVQNTDGTGPNTDLPFIEDGADPIPVELPAFWRRAETSVVVQNLFQWTRATIALAPRTLDMAETGPDLLCYIELESGDVADIDVSSVRLDGVLAPLGSPIAIEDHDGDGLLALVVTFDRSAVRDLVGEGVNVELEVSGVIAGEENEIFVGVQSLSVIEPTDVVTLSDSVVELGSDVALGWSDAGEAEVAYDGFLSLDGGESWTQAFTGVTAETSHLWHVTGAVTTDARMLVVARTPELAVMESVSDPFEIVSSTVSVPETPVRTELLRVAPNPTFGTTVLSFALANDARVELSIFDVSGRLVRRLSDASLPAGTHAISWDGRDAAGARVSSGVYHYAFAADGVERTGRLLLIR